MNEAKTKNMMSAAAVTTRAAPEKPFTMAPFGVAGVHVALAHARHQEHLVVHGQTEQHGHEDDRQEAQDRAGDHAERGREPAPLEDRDDHAERGEDREQESDGGLDGHEHRPEHHHEQQDREADDDRARTGCSALLSRCEMSICTAVAPVTSSGVFHFLSIDVDRSRMRLTSAVVVGRLGRALRDDLQDRGVVGLVGQALADVVRRREASAGRRGWR